MHSPNPNYYSRLRQLLPEVTDRATALRINPRLIEAWDRGEATQGKVPAVRLRRITLAAENLDDTQQLLETTEKSKKSAETLAAWVIRKG